MKKFLIVATVLIMAIVAVAGQCRGITKKGTQCKRNASPGSSYCWQHGGTTASQRAAGITADEGRCKAITKAGTQCTRAAQNGSMYCWQHAGAHEAGSEVNDKEQGVHDSGNQDSPERQAVVQCTAITKKGVRCTRRAKPNSNRCWQHDE